MDRLSPAELELFAWDGKPVGAAEPVGALELLGQREPGGDAGIAAEEPAEQVGTVTIAAAMQQDDMGRQRLPDALAAVEHGPHGVKRLLVGEVPAPAGDAPLQEQRPAAGPLQLRVIVALDGQHVQSIEGGLRVPSLAVFVRLRKVLGCEWNDLFLGL